ncbi:MAG: PQQ-dependent sugar dehydrogenase [Gemmatimonadaceae bacterium]
MRSSILVLLLAVAPLACGSSPADVHSVQNTTADAAGGVSASRAAEAPVESRLTVPAGMQATILATVVGARALTVGPDGALYVSQPVSNQITRLAMNASGVVESSTVAVRGLNKPNGTAFHNGWFYIANTDGVVRVKLDSSGRAIGTPEQLNHFSGDGMHWTRSIVFGPDNKMYVAAGSDCNVCIEKDSTRAAVMQYDESGKNGRLFAIGLRNAVGLAFNPVTRELWVTQNERDNLKPSHENLPPDELNILRAGGDYGWPYCYGDRIPNPEFHDAARCANTIPPALALPAHSAPLGMTFLDHATQLPDSDRGDALVAFHGSWNRSVPTKARLVRVRIQDNKPVGIEDFVTGWQGSNDNRWGRPVDIAVLHDGSLAISDDASGEIIRIAKK